MVYASEDKWAMQLRNFTNNLGLLAVNNKFNDRGLAYLPFGVPEGFQENCRLTNKTLNIPCFLAGKLFERCIISSGLLLQTEVTSSERDNRKTKKE